MRSDQNITFILLPTILLVGEANGIFVAHIAVYGLDDAKIVISRRKRHRIMPPFSMAYPKLTLGYFSLP